MQKPPKHAAKTENNPLPWGQRAKAWFYSAEIR